MLVKVDLFNDLNRFRQSSCGVQFFCSKYLDHLLPFLPVLLFFIPSGDLFPPLSALLLSPSCIYFVILSEFSLTFWSVSLFLQQPPFPDVTGPLWYMALWKSLW